jgi:hypothetical protein
MLLFVTIHLPHFLQILHLILSFLPLHYFFFPLSSAAVFREHTLCDRTAWYV